MTPIRRVLSVTFPLTHAMFPLVAAECVAMGVSPQDWTVRIRIGSSLVLSASRLGSNYWNELRLSYFLHIAHPKSILRQAFARGCATELLSKSLGSECHEGAVDEFYVQSALCSRWKAHGVETSVGVYLLKPPSQVARDTFKGVE